LTMAICTRCSLPFLLVMAVYQLLLYTFCHLVVDLDFDSISNLYQFEYPDTNVNVSKHSTVTICCIVKYEERYIDEWIKYHLLLGFDHITIYDNSDNASLINYYQSEHIVYDGKVDIIHYPGYKKQRKVYQTCLEKNQQLNITWTAFIDIDEFIVLKQHENIKSFLTEYQPILNGNSISLSRFCFGSNGYFNYSQNGNDVIDRYIRREQNSSQGLKSIIYLPHALKMRNPHFAKMARINGTQYGMIVIGNDMTRVLRKTRKNKKEKGLNPERHVFFKSENIPELFDNDCKIACINHYNLKSLQFWRDKRLRGNAYGPSIGHTHPDYEWYRMNRHCNDRIDTFARDWIHNRTI